jgi:hypothetical protein
MFRSRVLQHQSSPAELQPVHVRVLHGLPRVVHRSELHVGAPRGASGARVVRHADGAWAAEALEAGLHLEFSRVDALRV